jgi:hypothetical protein
MSNVTDGDCCADALRSPSGLTDDEAVRLDEAIAHWRDALSLIPVDSPDRTRILSNLCSMLLNRFARFGTSGDMDEAIVGAREALALTPPDSPDRAARLGNFSSALRLRYMRLGVRADLDEAISSTEEDPIGWTGIGVT